MVQIILKEPGRFESRKTAPRSHDITEALVRVRRVGVCGSDFKAFAGTHPAYSYPRVLGHEMSCEVVEAAPNEKGIGSGDLCAIDPYISCGVCHACRLGKVNCCEKLQILGIQTDGGMQSLFVVPLHVLHKSNILTLDQLALLEPLSVGFHAVQRSNLHESERVLVVGAGAIGLAVLQFALAGGANVKVLETRKERRALVEQFGVQAISSPDGKPADLVFDATGSAKAMEASFNYIASGGRIVFVGLITGRVSFDDWDFHRREVTVLASRGNLRHFPQIIQMIENKKIDPTPWITDRLGLEDVPKIFHELPHRQNLVKAIVEISEST